MINDLINKLVDHRFKQQTIVCKVLRVSESNATCDCRPVNGAADFLGVRLQSAIGHEQLGLVAFPAVGSLVLIGLIEGNDSAACVLLSAGLTAIKVKMQDFELDLNTNEMLFNGGLNGGLVIISKLIERLNSLERAHNKLVVSHNAHVHPANGTPSANPSTSSVLITQAGQIENPKIKH